MTARSNDVELLARIAAHPEKSWAQLCKGIYHDSTAMYLKLASLYQRRLITQETFTRLNKKTRKRPPLKSAKRFQQEGLAAVKAMLKKL